MNPRLFRDRCRQFCRGVVGIAALGVAVSGGGCIAPRVPGTHLTSQLTIPRHSDCPVVAHDSTFDIRPFASRGITPVPTDGWVYASSSCGLSMLVPPQTSVGSRLGGGDTLGLTAPGGYPCPLRLDLSLNSGSSSATLVTKTLSEIQAELVAVQDTGETVIYHGNPNRYSDDDEEMSVFALASSISDSTGAYLGAELKTQNACLHSSKTVHLGLRYFRTMLESLHVSSSASLWEEGQ